MKRNYRYAAAIVLVLLLMWCSYYLYMQYRPVNYQNGTFVELPEQNHAEQELLA